MRTHILVASVAVFIAASAASAASASSGEPIGVAHLRADFTQLYDELKVSHFDLYARRPKADYDALFAKMLAGFDRPLPLPEAHVRFQKFLAYGRIAHSLTDGYRSGYSAWRDKGGKAWPLGLTFVRGRAYVVEKPGGVEGISLGDEVLAIDGQPMRQWIERLGAYVSADNDYMLQTLLEFYFPALLWLEAGSRPKFTVRVGPADIEVPALSESEARARAQPAGTLALDWNERTWRMTAGGVAYLRPGPFYDNAPDTANMWDTAAFSKFIDGAFEGMLAAKARVLVIDLRNNAGGDNSFSDLMVSWFAGEPYRFVSEFRIRVSNGAIETNRRRLEMSSDPNDMSHKLAAAYRGRKPGEVIDFEIPFACPRKGRRFEGDVLLLVNRHSYSNTVMVAALAQDYGFATLVGEETSDLSTTYGAMEQFELRHTGITIGFPKALIVRPSGALEPRGVVPDVPIQTPILESKDDPVLKQALAIAANTAKQGTAPRRKTLSPKIGAALARQKPCR
jgi:C-terminal processing protease CtpA/Prc